MRDADETRSVGLRLGYSEVGEFPRLFTSLDLECAFWGGSRTSSTDAGMLFGLPRKIGTIGLLQTVAHPRVDEGNSENVSPGVLLRAMGSERDRQIHLIGLLYKPRSLVMQASRG